MGDLFFALRLPDSFRKAACRPADPRLFDDTASPEQWVEAKAICDTCPITAECLRLALDEHRPSFSGGRPVYCAVGQVNAYRHLLAREAAPLLDVAASDAFELVCAEHGVTPAEMRSRSRDFTAARDSVLHDLRHRAGLSYPALGRLVGRDHSSVIASVGRAARAMA